MKKILGLDLGVASIGWAFIEEGPTTSLIKGMGVRVIPLSSDERDEFSSGSKISKNAKRRIKRGMRRNIYRRTLRKDLLKEFLKLNAMFPSEHMFDSVQRDALWSLRARAAVEKIELEELGRVLFHLNQKRGFKSNRKVDADESDEAKETEYKAEIRKNAEALKESGFTLGQWVNHNLQENSHFKLKGNIFPREVYIGELNAIWNTQTNHHPSLSPTLLSEVRDKIIFHQRPLKSQKALVSRCEFVKRTALVNGKRMDVAPRVAPRTAPLTQLCKIWESVNNLQFEDNYGKPVIPTLPARQKLVAELRHSAKVTSKQLLKILSLPSDLNISKLGEKGIQGDITFASISTVLARHESGKNLLQSIQLFNPQVVEVEMVDQDTGEMQTIREVSSEHENSDYFKIWHLLYSVEDENALSRKLKATYDLSDECIKELSKLDFAKPGFSNKSNKAVRMILPHLLDGHKYSTAMEYAGFRHSDFLDKAENEARTLLETIPNLPKNSLRQPVVERVLNQLINVVNEIIKDPKFGRPDEIRVELARQLQQSREERSRETTRISKLEKINSEIENRLREEYGMKRVTRSLISKYKMWDEMNGISIYTGKPITLSDFLNGRGVEVEHIIPRSKLFDDSQSNKTMAESWVNKAKGNMTAHDFMENAPVPGLLAFEEYIIRVNRLASLKDGARISRTKYKRLLTSESEIPADFISRQLRETQYITKKAMQILRLACREVHATSGGVTDFLRDKWGWNDVLKKINWDIYEAAGQTRVETAKDGKQIYIIDNWSKRDDHRHHAIDALVVACTKQSYIQTLNNLRKSFDRSESGQDLKTLDNPKLKEIAQLAPFSTDDVVKHTRPIIVSFKPGKRIAVRSTNKSTGHRQLIPRGALSEETVYGKIKIQKQREVPLNKSFDPNWLIVDKAIRKLVQHRLSEHGNDPSKAFKTPLCYDSSEKTPIKKVSIHFWEDEYVVKYPITTLKRKDLEYVVDPVVKEKLEEFFERFETEKEAIKNIGTSTIWFNEEKKIPIRTVRLRTGLGNLSANKSVHPSEVKGYVKPGNNHHLAIYEREDGTLFDKMVTFQEAFTRKTLGQPVYETHCEDGVLKWKFEQNNLFEILNKEGESKIYRVQNISKKSDGAITVFFRLNTETSLKDAEIYKSIGLYHSARNLSNLLTLKPFPISINVLGFEK